MLNAKNNETDWDLVRQKKDVHVSGPISSRDFNSVAASCTEVTGSDYCLRRTVDEALVNRELIRWLPNWASPQIPVFAVYSSGKFLL